MKKVTDKLMTNIRGLSFILIAITIAALTLSCQRAEEPKEKESPQVEKQALAPSEPEAEVKPEAPIPAEVKEKPTAASQARIKEKPISKAEEVSPLKKPEKTIEEYLAESPLTEEEQKKFEECGGNWSTPDEICGSDLEFLRILVKGDHRTIRWYHSEEFKRDYGKFYPEYAKTSYDNDLATAILAVNPRNKEAFELIKKVLETKQEYSGWAMQDAAKAIKHARDNSVIPLLREVAKHPEPSVRLQAAGSLISLGDIDTALPILEELTMKEGYTGSLYYLFTGPGKIIDERGYAIVEKALGHETTEVRISAVKLMLDAEKITNEQAEETALGILEELKDRTIKDYGLEIGPGGGINDLRPAPGSGITDVRKVEQEELSDGRACTYAMELLGNLKSGKALITLREIENRNTKWWYVCLFGIRESIKTIESDGG